MAGEHMTGSGDTTEQLIHLLDEALQLCADHERSLERAEQARDGELAALLREGLASSRHLAQRARELLTARLANPQPVISVEPDASAGYRLRSFPGPQTNSHVRSGGREGDDLVDEQSKESFPASDSPAHY